MLHYIRKIYKNFKFPKMIKESTEFVGAAVARILRYEGLKAHARTGDIRLRK